MFRAFLKVADRCDHCGEELHHHRADDFPAYLVIVIVGHLIVPLVLHVEMAYDPAPIREFLDDDRAAYVIMSRDDYAGIDAATDRPTCILATQPTFNVKLRDILAREPGPDLVLVTNRCQ